MPSVRVKPTVDIELKKKLLAHGMNVHFEIPKNERANPQGLSKNQRRYQNIEMSIQGPGPGLDKLKQHEQSQELRTYFNLPMTEKLMMSKCKKDIADCNTLEDVKD